jgi:hypothetical protein
MLVLHSLSALIVDGRLEDDAGPAEAVATRLAGLVSDAFAALSKQRWAANLKRGTPQDRSRPQPPTSRVSLPPCCLSSRSWSRRLGVARGLSPSGSYRDTAAPYWHHRDVGRGFSCLLSRYGCEVDWVGDEPVPVGVIRSTPSRSCSALCRASTATGKPCTARRRAGPQKIE